MLAQRCHGLDRHSKHPKANVYCSLQNTLKWAWVFSDQNEFYLQLPFFLFWSGQSMHVVSCSILIRSVEGNVLVAESRSAPLRFWVPVRVNFGHRSFNYCGRCPAYTYWSFSWGVEVSLMKWVLMATWTADLHWQAANCRVNLMQQTLVVVEETTSFVVTFYPICFSCMFYIRVVSSNHFVLYGQ